MIRRTDHFFCISLNKLLNSQIIGTLIHNDASDMEMLCFAMNIYI